MSTTRRRPATVPDVVLEPAAEADVLRDEGEAYARRLRAAGVDVTAVRYQGVFHDFMMLNALAETKATRQATRQTAQALKAALFAQP